MPRIREEMYHSTLSCKILLLRWHRMKEGRKHPYFETTCLSIIFVSKLMLKRTTLHGTAESSSFILLVEREG